jgi:DNA polymerase
VSKNTTFSSPDENRRRYYLDVMGIQCWQLRNAEDRQTLEQDPQTTDNRDVISAEIVTQSNSWPQLKTAIQQCDKCQLCVTRKQAIAGRGNQSAELMFVLLAPGSSDDEAGTICSGEANDLLGKMLAAINVPIDDVYITSLLKCKVPAKHTVSPQEIKQCFVYLKQQIQLIQPKLLIVLGETTIRCLLQKNLSLDDFRVMNTESQYQVETVPLFVSYSPQELLQQAENKRKAWADLQQLQKLIKN